MIIKEHVWYKSEKVNSYYYISDFFEGEYLVLKYCSDFLTPQVVFVGTLDKCRDYLRYHDDIQEV